MTGGPLELSHGLEEVNGVRLHYVRAGEGPPVVLLHGWGSTSFMWRKLMTLLAESYTVVAPDLRGIGDSDKPEGGYEKLSLARDVNGLVERLELGPVRLVGHDLGGPVAYLYAAALEAPVERLAMLETVLFGVPFELDPRIVQPPWHVAFHAEPGLAEALVVGRERTYLRFFYERDSYDPGMIEEEAIDEYARCYAGSDSLRASFEWYRTLPRDAADIQEAARNRLQIPVLALGGDSSLGVSTENAMRAVADDVDGHVVERCGHWMPEERPDEVAERLRTFLR